jgi:glycosyltransferase involved in cell wall biosynthesis
MRSKTKIGFDLAPLTDEATFGVSEYAIHLIEALANLDEFQLCLLHPWSLRFGEAKLTSLKVERIPFQLRLLGTNWWEQLVFPTLAARAGCDVLHSVGNVAPRFSTRPVVLTLHDIITYAGKASVPPGTMNYLRRFGVPGVRRADAIVTISETSRREIAEFFGIDPANIHVVPNGVGKEFFTAPSGEAIRNSSPVILASGSLAPNKNLKVTLQAFAGILHHHPSATLMLFSIGPGTETGITEMAAANGIRSSAINFVRAPDAATMGRIFASADVLLFPSLREGFGLPIVEAFAAGVPVVTSNSGALAETSGDAALLANPEDPAALASSVLGILQNEDLRRRLIELGRQRANLFTWEQAATQITK